MAYVADTVMTTGASLNGGKAGRTLIETLGLWIEVRAERRRLARLPAERLADMGISKAQARSEASRPFWDVQGR